MEELKPTNIKRSIISVFNKDGILPLAKALESKSVDIYSTGGTFKVLQDSGIDVKKISDLTSFPEILKGRVKTLHPMIFSGILADSTDPSHERDLKDVNAKEFQLVIVNLYPFAQTLRSGENDHEKIIEMIDIGGPSMLRAAAKNFKNVVVLSDPGQYEEFLERFESGDLNYEYRRSLAGSVFTHTTMYDYSISRYFSDSDTEELPDVMLSGLNKVKTLRYGENPDQKAAIYSPISDNDWAPFDILGGKELSYNNYVDSLVAYEIVKGLSDTACAIIKHANPCGFGISDTFLKAYRRAVNTDPVSYFGGIVAINGAVNAELAEELTKSFLECIVAQSYTEEALSILSRKKRLRLLIPRTTDIETKISVKSYGTGALVQELQSYEDNIEKWQTVTDKLPNAEHSNAVRLGWHLVKSVKSNSIVLADDTGAVGIGAGQMSRIDSFKIALRKASEAGLSVKNTVVASDAFFPFRDSIDLAADNEIAGVIQPGGSIRDKDVIDACNEHGIFMIFTGKRVFKH